MSDTLNSNINTGLVIDPVTRNITLKDGKEKIFVAKNDHNSTALTFEIPKSIDGHDMASEDTLIYIHFLNMDGEDVSKTLGGICNVTDKATNTESGTLSFSWRVPKIATGYAGILSLGVTFECYESTDGSVEEVYSWSSAPFSDIVVCDSLDEGKTEVKREYNHLVETCNAIVKAALNGEYNYLVKNALKEAKENGDFKGDKGDRGEGWVVRGYYTTLDKLKASVDSPLQGDTYAVGKSEPYTYYAYDSTEGWVNQGTFSPVLAQSYAIGGTGVREGEDSDNAKFYSKKAETRLKDTANALRATVTGTNSVEIEDASPFEHDMTVRVTSPSSISLLDYNFANIGEIGGVHADINDDGSIHVSGSCNLEEAGTNYTVLKAMHLEAGLYTATLKRSASNEPLEFSLSSNSDFSNIIATVESTSSEDAEISFTLDEKQYVYIGVKTQFNKGENYDFTFKPKLALGRNEAFDLSDLKYIKITDSENNRVLYNCTAKACDTSFSMTVKSLMGNITVETDDKYNFKLEVEYNADTNILNDKFCQAVDGEEVAENVLFLEKVSSNRHSVDLNLKSTPSNNDFGSFKVYGNNLLNVAECILDNCDITSYSETSGMTLKQHVDTYGIEMLVMGDLWEIFHYLRESRVFTFSTSSKLAVKEYMAIRFTYDDGSEDEFVGDKGSNALTFTYVPPSDKELCDIYLYPRKQDELFTAAKTITGLQVEIGEKSPYEQYSDKEYSVNDEAIEEAYSTVSANCKIPSVASKMTIRGMGETTLSASYKKDINKIIEELQNAILSLGGNI